MLRRTGAVPPDSEYDDYPRGRVAYNTKTGKYSLLLDRCILKNKSVVNKIMSELNLPTKRTKSDMNILPLKLLGFMEGFRSSYFETPVVSSRTSLRIGFSVAAIPSAILREPPSFGWTWSITMRYSGSLISFRPSRKYRL